MAGCENAGWKQKTALTCFDSHWQKSYNCFEKQPFHSGGLLSLAKQKENQLVGFQPFHQAPPLYQAFSKISRIKLELSNNMHLASANAKSAIMNEYHCAHARKLGEAVSYCTVQIFFDLACLHPSRFGKPWGKGAKGSWLSQRQHSGETSGWTLKRGVERGKTWENKRDRQKHEKNTWIAEGKTEATSSSWGNMTKVKGWRWNEVKQVDTKVYPRHTQQSGGLLQGGTGIRVFRCSNTSHIPHCLAW